MPLNQYDILSTISRPTFPVVGRDIQTSCSWSRWFYFILFDRVIDIRLIWIDVEMYVDASSKKQ